MNELLLKSLTEAVESLKKEVQETQKMIKELPNYSPGIEKANQRMDAIQKEINGIPARISVPESSLKELSNGLTQHTQQLKIPLRQDVRHHHHLAWSISIGLFLLAIILTLTIWLGRVLNEKTASTMIIKNPDLRAYTMNHLAEIVNYFDSNMTANPKGFTRQLTEAEQRLQKLTSGTRHNKGLPVIPGVHRRQNPRKGWHPSDSLNTNLPPP